MITLPVILEAMNSRVDNTWKLTFATNEISPDKVGQLSSCIKGFGYMAFKPENFTTSEIDALNGLETKFEGIGKSPSQRLRNVLLVAFKQDNEGFTTFNNYYESKMENIITHFKNKLV
jgi:hypothetical protein